MCPNPITGPAHTVTNTGEPNRDVLDVKANRIPSTSTPISRCDYTVNGINQRTQVQATGSAFPSQPADWTWGYDALGQVTSADSPTITFDRAYEYDLIGNRKRSSDGALVTTGAATVYEPNPLNQYSSIQLPLPLGEGGGEGATVQPAYDPDGNATAYPLPVAPNTNATLAYDGENRLISVTIAATTVTYTYDSQSRRVARSEGSNTKIYLYDAWNCVAEYTLHNSSFNLHTSHTWGLDLSGSLQGAGGVGGLLAVNLLSSVSGSSVFFPTYDGNGNISEYLASTGSIAAHYEYDPFGRTIVADGPQAADFAYRFSTKPVEPATGLYYYGYRWFDPDSGRWINRDPIGEDGGGNLYGFVGNDGVESMDNLGKVEVKWGGVALRYDGNSTGGVMPIEGMATQNQKSIRWDQYTLGVTTSYFSVKPVCCKDSVSGKWKYDKASIVYGSIIHLKSPEQYQSTEQFRFAFSCEIDHAIDERNYQKVYESEMNKYEHLLRDWDSDAPHASETACLNNALRRLENMLMIHAKKSTLKSLTEWDVSGKHGWLDRRRKPIPPDLPQNRPPFYGDYYGLPGIALPPS